jgi:DNA-binding transcriptional ArsR family regulator
VRLRDIAAALEITERSAYALVSDLAEAGYIVKEKDGRRNRYRIQTDLPLREPVTRERTIGEVLDLLVEASAPADDAPVAHESSASHGAPAWAWQRLSGQT